MTKHTNNQNKEVRIIDGKKIAEEILLDLRKKIIESKKIPGLAVILIGDDPASKLYVRNKEKACHKIGINCSTYLCNKDCCPHASENEIIEMIKFLNNDNQISGIIVQLPLPKKFDTNKIISAIDPKKDVDGFHPKNLEKMLKGNFDIMPPLIGAIIQALASEDINLKNKQVIIISNSEIFAPAISKKLQDLGCITKVVSNNDKDLKTKTTKADILISIIGQPQFINKEMIKKDAVLIDAGITMVGKKFKGDIDFESVKKKALCITPTPGGIGPLTVAMLLKNIYLLAK